MNTAPIQYWYEVEHCIGREQAEKIIQAHPGRVFALARNGLLVAAVRDLCGDEAADRLAARMHGGVVKVARREKLKVKLARIAMIEALARPGISSNEISRRTHIPAMTVRSYRQSLGI